MSQCEASRQFMSAKIILRSQLPDDHLITSFFEACIANKLYNVIVLEKIFWMFINTDIEKHCDCHQCSQITNGHWSVDCAKRSSSLSSEDFYGNDVAKTINEINTNQIKASLGILNDDVFCVSIMTDVKCLVGLVFCLININAHHAYTTVSQK